MDGIYQYILATLGYVSIEITKGMQDRLCDLVLHSHNMLNLYRSTHSSQPKSIEPSPL